MLMDCSRIGLRPDQTIAEVWPGDRVDVGLRYRAPQSALERVQKDALARVDQWCQEYEDRIRAMGGIGFFLGGIGPDGHVGFNVRGSDHHSTTRLSPTNYPTQAAAAVDLGGIEVARHRLVITIGLGTITFNPQCTAVIMASGAAKAKVVADAVQREPDVLYPATALHSAAERPLLRHHRRRRRPGRAAVQPADAAGERGRRDRRRAPSSTWPSPATAAWPTWAPTTSPPTATPPPCWSAVRRTSPRSRPACARR